MAVLPRGSVCCYRTSSPSIRCRPNGWAKLRAQRWPAIRGSSSRRSPTWSPFGCETEVVREEIMVTRNKNEDTYRRGRIWYARLVGGDRMMPMRMEVDTEFGVVTGYLADLRGRGVGLHLMRE